ncbi:jg15333 [Pararge aegeria aegeria]|uniref:Jg15333 protein n=1 Tax=Pararge aegeria aegeria TaxID=348720 RepID=A0A8S4RG24_9NEOP|nr:jg15333 [Pararge aegeria aegeria]
MVFREIDWSNKGINISGEYLSHLRFADDIVIFAECPKTLNDMITQLAQESKKVGLFLNKDKTKIITNGDKQRKIIVENEEIEFVNEYIYLGQLTSFEDRMGKELQRRIALAWKKYWSLKEVMKNKDINISIKARLYDVAILPCLIYGCQTWTLRKADEEKIAVCQRKMERSMLGVKLSDRLNNQKLRKRTGVSDAPRQVILLKWKWAGHVCRANTISWTKILTSGCHGIRKGKEEDQGNVGRTFLLEYVDLCG